MDGGCANTTRLHVAALVDPEVENQRILAFAHPFNFNDVLACLRKLAPGKTFPEDVERLGRDLNRLDNRPGAELLRKSGRKGWVGMEDSVEDNAGLCDGEPMLRLGDRRSYNGNDFVSRITWSSGWIQMCSVD